MSVAKKMVSIVVVAGMLVSSVVTYMVWHSAENALITEATQTGDLIVRETARSIQQSLRDAITTTSIFAQMTTWQLSQTTLPSTIDSIDVVNADGLIVETYPDGVDTYDTASLKYESHLATQALTTHSTAFGDVFANDDAQPGLMIATPMLNSTMPLIVVAHVNWSHITSVLYRIDNYHVRLFGADHTLIASPDQTDETFFFSRTPYEALYPPLVSDTSSVPQVITSIYTAEPLILASAPWSVVSFISRDVVLRASLLETQRLVIFAGVLLAVCIVCMIQLLEMVMIRPLRELTAATVRNAEGDPEPFPLLQSSDEFGVLARSFEALASKDRLAHIHFEEMVQERTQALQTKIRELQSTQRVLQEETAKDEALFSSITDGIVAIDAQGIVVKVNVAATQILDAHDTVLVGRPWADVVDVMYDNRVVPENKRPSTFALKGNVITSTAYALRLHNGSQFDTAFSAAPILLRGKIIGAIIVFRNISMQKAIDRTKTEFVTLASHQLRTPLSAVNWSTELLLSGDAGKLTPDQRIYVKEVYTGVQRMIRLVNGLLQLSSFEMGESGAHGEHQHASLNVLVRQILREQKTAIAEKKLHVSVKKSTNLPDVVGDALLLTVVMQTLIDNACKYSKKGGTVLIKLTSVVPGTLLHGALTTEPMVLCEVSDQGYGIPLAERSRIFDKFYRGSNITEYSADGNGISLYLSKGIVERLSGKMWFESEQGKGSTFFVAFLAASLKK